MTDNPFTENIGANPYSIDTSGPTTNAQTWVVTRDGYSKQIPFVGIFNIAQACLEILMTGVLVCFSFMMFNMANDPKFQKMNEVNQKFDPVILQIGAMIASVAVGLIGLARLAAGIMTLYKRGRIFTLVTSVVGLATTLTVYCCPTTIAVAIYTLVILVQPSVIEEYRLARQ